MTTFLFLQLEGLAYILYFLKISLHAILAVLLALTPLLYGTACTLHWAYTHRRFGQHLLRGFRARFIRGYTALDNHDDDGDDDEGKSSDRIENPDRYHRQNLAHFPN